MGEKREKTKHNYRLLSLLALALFQPLFISTFAEQIAWAESVILQFPTSQGVGGDHFGYSASRGRLHAGVDLRAQSPTPVSYIGNAQPCTPAGPSGIIIGNVANACGVTQRFLHLTSCSGGKFITGNSGINPATHRNYDFHLHWEVLINGTAVDPEQAVGKDLCNEQVRKDLLEDAKKKGSGSGGGGAATGINQPAPPANPGGSIAYVPPGATNPITGTVNTGTTPIYYEVTPSGQVIISIAPELGDENAAAILPPSETNVVPTGASGGELSGCATDTWTAMVNQSVMQTRREMMYNERFVAKGDSVLAYSCFEKTMTDVTGKTVGVFSTTKAWVNKQIDIVGKTLTVNKELGTDTMDGAIRNAAVVPVESFINGAFSHDFLGGMMSGGAGDDESSQQNNAPCGKMLEVWNAAKCMNFTDTTPFRKFDELTDANNDPRIYPPTMQCKNTGITQGMIDIAQNKSAKFDKINLHLDMLSPPGNTCFDALSTGVTVVRRKGSDIISQEVNYPDGVCISPGCSYQNAGASGKGSCQVKGP